MIFSTSIPFLSSFIFIISTWSPSSSFSNLECTKVVINCKASSVSSFSRILIFSSWYYYFYWGGNNSIESNSFLYFSICCLSWFWNDWERKLNLFEINSIRVSVLLFVVSANVACSSGSYTIYWGSIRNI